ncbi:MAG: Bifunctional protein HldE [Syntrophus sp. SKADARSKE-3]|nr:Bifunctional protein HldE [Syntrophus sp. SKADARSKE-3]
MKRIVVRKRALDIIENFPSASVLVVGDIMVDHFIWGRVSRISPEAPVPVVDVNSDKMLLGGSANVMNNIYAMDGLVYGVGIIGSDDIGERLLKELGERRINTDGIIVETDRPTTLKTRIVAHGQQVVRFDRESRMTVDRKSTEKMIAHIEAVRHTLGAIIVSDYNKGVITAPLLDGIRDVIQGTDIIVCVDPKKSDFTMYRSFDIITPNHHEAGRAAGFDIVDYSTLIKSGTEILNRYDLKALLITRGEEGMSLFERADKIIHTEFPTEAREVFDVTGAGDTAIGVFALCMASGATFKEAAFLANRAAGIAVGKSGTATVSRKELKKTL